MSLAGSIGRCARRGSSARRGLRRRRLASSSRSSESRTRSVSTPKSIRQATSSTPTADTCSTIVGGVVGRAEQAARVAGSGRRRPRAAASISSAVSDLNSVVGVLARVRRTSGTPRRRRLSRPTAVPRYAFIGSRAVSRGAVGVAVEERVQHQRDAALARDARRRATRRGSARSSSRELLDRLAEQVGEHVGAERAGPLERRRRCRPT